MSEVKTPDKAITDPTSPDAAAEVGKLGAFGAFCVFAVAILLYLATLAPTVTLIDSGELIVAARYLGVAHPPGFPLYLILAHAASYLPFGDIAYRVNFASAVFGAFAACAMTLLVIEAMRFRQDVKETRLGAVIGPAVFAGLLFAFSRTLWAYSTIAEVYTLNALLIVSVLGTMFSWRRVSAAGDIKKGSRRLYIAAFVFGLALGVHHVTIAITLPALAVFVLLTEGSAFFRSRPFLYAVLAAIAGLSIYLYLPIAASRAPVMNWGDPSTLERFWWHVSARQYQAFFDFSLGRIEEFAGLAIKEFGYVWAPLALGLAVFGLIQLFRREKPVFWLLTLIITADLFYCLSYEIAEDKDAYYLPAFIALIIAAGFGVRELMAALASLRPKVLGVVLTTTVLAGVPMIALIANYVHNDRSEYLIAQDYMENIFRSVETDGMLITSDWQVYSPLLYEREVAKRRRDVIAININQLRRSWYFDYLEQAYPETLAASRAQVDAFLGDLRAWESDPSSFNRDSAAADRIDSRFYEMVRSFVTNQLKKGPVYVTWEMIMDRDGPDAAFTRALIENYALAPSGIVFRVAEKNTPLRIAAPEINTRGLADAASRFDEQDVVRTKVVPAYVNMALNNGIVHASNNNHAFAIKHFEKALALDPTFEPAKRALAASRQELRTMPAR